MKYLYVCIALCIATNMGFGQGKDRASLDPEVTEVWEPIPPKVNIVNGVPSDAQVLFDGSDFSNWIGINGGDVQWDLVGDAMTVKLGTGGITTRDSFGDFQLHIEWASPEVITGEGQGRGNSGIFLQNRYEVQVLDSYESRTYSNGQASAIYKQAIPLVNACKPPGEWQTYDIIYTAPRFNDNGRKISNAKVTVLHNGVVTLNDFEIWGTTQYKGLPSNEPHGDAPITLQDHSNLVKYRNIWIRRM
ncbi:3-keto-disaccharide hydrolase [Portibacter marinus]|uniref:3-keto-disaccharide hydrolase n=1 Tax=Portibacter marinus TaxID=2898660 RepID=UPI001F4347E3|nr:DUF1080 domain-containing protein [Portibacter marinus]